MKTILSLMALLLISTGVNAQTYLCDQCRDLSDFPGDAGEFAINGVFGPDGGISPNNANSIADIRGSVR